MTPLCCFPLRSLLLICISLCSLLSFSQQPPPFVWGRTIWGDGMLNVNYSVVDLTGNIYMAGTFTGSADFDPGPDNTTLTSAGDSDVFISKFNSSGNLVWVEQVGGPGVDKATFITQDATGNIYVTGSFSGTVDFDPGAGTAPLSALAGSDAFVAKYDAAGNYIWAVSFAETDNSTGKAVAVDPTFNVYVTGNFTGTITFGTDTSYTSLGGNDAFICKLNSTGGVVWADRIGGNSLENATGIAADATGNVYACGNFENGTIDLDPGPGSANYLAGTSIVYLVKLNASGDLVWAIRSFAHSANDLKMNAAGNLFLVGGLSNSTDMDPGPGTAYVGVNRTFTDYFWELTSDGAYVLAKSYLGTDATGDAWSVNVDATGNIYTAGGTGAFNKWDNAGNPIWGSGYGVNNWVMNIAVDGMQHVYTIGNYHTIIDLDPGPDTVIVRNVHPGIFFNQLAQTAAGSLPLTWISLDGHLNDRQQSTLNFTVNEESIDHYTVEKSTDGITFSNIGSLKSKGNGTNTYVYTESTVLNQTAWYRILQMGLDERSGYSAVVRITEGKARLSATVFPVPSRGNVTLQIRGEELLHTKAILVDMKGLPVRSIQINDYNTPVNLYNLPAGMYLLQLANGSSLKIMRE